MLPTQAHAPHDHHRASVFALAFAVWLARWVLSRERGKPESAAHLRRDPAGAEAFLTRQYRTISVLAIVVAVVILRRVRISPPPESERPGHRPALAGVVRDRVVLLGALSSVSRASLVTWTAVRANNVSGRGPPR